MKRFAGFLLAVLALATVSAPAAGSQPSVAAPSPAAGLPLLEARAPFPPRVLPYEALDGLVIQHAGRRKPFLTFALEVTRELSGRAAFALPEVGRVEARALAASLFLGQAEWIDQPILSVPSAELRTTLGLPPGAARASPRELGRNPKLSELVETVRMKRAREGGEVRLSSLEKEAELLAQRLVLFQSLATGMSFTIVPPADPATVAWGTVTDLPRLHPAERLGPVHEALHALVVAYHHGGSAADFSAAAARLIAAQRDLAPERLPAAAKLAVERAYDNLHPFRWAWIAYLLGGLAFAVTWRFASRAGAVVGWSLIALGALAHLGGFAARTYVSGRPPVTNMYESIVWVAIGLVAFAIWFELRHRSRYFIVSAAPLAALFMVAADSLPIVLSPALNPLTAVLRDNFWLTTHVLTITTSYAAFALAMAVAHVALGRQILWGGSAAIGRDLYAYIYWTIAVGLVLLIPGIILGGVWANYAWGRFWGWDPKETAALIAALVYLFILHGRLAGWWSPFGFAVGAVLGFQGIVLAWYGVNFVLGAGLHSYGFGSGGQGWVGAFAAFEVLFVGAAIVSRIRARRRQPAAEVSARSEGAESSARSSAPVS